MPILTTMNEINKAAGAGVKWLRRGKEEVKLSHIDDEKVYGYYKDKKLGWIAADWDANTGWFGYREGSFLELIEVKPRIKQTLWLNLYEGIAYGYPKKDSADTHSRADRIACVKVEIDYEKGEGL